LIDGFSHGKIHHPAMGAAPISGNRNGDHYGHGAALEVVTGFLAG